jgi:hypothetical protein
MVQTIPEDLNLNNLNFKDIIDLTADDELDEEKEDYEFDDVTSNSTTCEGTTPKTAISVSQDELNDNNNKSINSETENLTDDQEEVIYDNLQNIHDDLINILYKACEMLDVKLKHKKLIYAKYQKFQEMFIKRKGTQIITGDTFVLCFNNKTWFTVFYKGSKNINDLYFIDHATSRHRKLIEVIPDETYFELETYKRNKPDF